MSTTCPIGLSANSGLRTSAISYVVCRSSARRLSPRRHRPIANLATRLDGGFDLAPPLVLRPQVANMRSRWSAQVCLSAFAEIALDERVRPDIVRDARPTTQPAGRARQGARNADAQARGTPKHGSGCPFDHRHLGTRTESPTLDPRRGSGPRGATTLGTGGARPITKPARFDPILLALASPTRLIS